MRGNNKILLFFAVLIFIIFMVSENETTIGLSFWGLILLISSSYLSNYIFRIRFIRKIKKEKLDYIEVKESNKWIIMCTLISIYGICKSIKYKYDLFLVEKSSTSISLLQYINNFTTGEKLTLLGAVVVIIILSITILQVLLNKCIISSGKVIFFDGTVFDINTIDEIQYKDGIISKNKIIKLSKGFTERKISIDKNSFEKVKILLEENNII